MLERLRNKEWDHNAIDKAPTKRLRLFVSSSIVDSSIMPKMLLLFITAALIAGIIHLFYFMFWSLVLVPFSNWRLNSIAIAKECKMERVNVRHNQCRFSSDSLSSDIHPLWSTPTDGPGCNENGTSIFFLLWIFTKLIFKKSKGDFFQTLFFQAKFKCDNGCYIYSSSQNPDMYISDGTKDVMRLFLRVQMFQTHPDFSFLVMGEPDKGTKTELVVSYFGLENYSNYLFTCYIFQLQSYFRKHWKGSG